MAVIGNFIQQLHRRLGIRVKTMFRETRQKGNGKMELGGGSVWMTNATQLKGILKERDGDVEVGVGVGGGCINLAAGKLRYS